MKTCIECGKENVKKLVKGRCSKCASRKWREDHPDYQKGQYAKYQRKWHLSHKEDPVVQERIRSNRTKCREKHKEIYNERKRIMYRENIIDNKQKDAFKKRKPERRFKNAIKIAQRRNLDWTINYDQYICLIEQPCYYCNFLFGKRVETGIGLDRLNCELGYHHDNVVSACKLCNNLRNNILTPEETKAVVALILQLRGFTLPLPLLP